MQLGKLPLRARHLLGGSVARSSLVGVWDARRSLATGICLKVALVALFIE